MKQWYILAAVFLWAGICPVTAQDLIVLKDGSMIEAKVIEISPTEIRYNRFEHLDGPVCVVPAVDVFSIKYENGRTELINADPPAKQESVPEERHKRSTMDPDKFYFGVNGNPGATLLYGTSFCIEFGKDWFNTEINLIFPSLGGLVYDIDKGFGFLATLNYFWHSRIGGAYLGWGVGFVWQQRYGRYTDDVWYTEGYFDEYIFSFGVNGGYKFVLPVGLYFRVGSYIGLASGYADSKVNVYIKPDLAAGWSF
jgi:hypothetical protein